MTMNRGGIFVAFVSPLGVRPANNMAKSITTGRRATAGEFEGDGVVPLRGQRTAEGGA